VSHETNVITQHDGQPFSCNGSDPLYPTEVPFMQELVWTRRGEGGNQENGWSIWWCILGCPASTHSTRLALVVDHFPHSFFLPSRPSSRLRRGEPLLSCLLPCLDALLHLSSRVAHSYLESPAVRYCEPPSTVVLASFLSHLSQTSWVFACYSGQ
jgi:hypothetical protein